MERTALKVLAVLVAAIIGLLLWENHRMEQEAANLRNEVRTSRLEAENAIALSEVTYLDADQWRRRATQAELERDELAKELEERPVVETVVTVEVPAGEVEAPVEPQLEGYHANFEDEFIIAEVDFREVDLQATLRYDIKPFTLKIGVRCGDIDSVSLVRPAIVTVDQGRLPVIIQIEEANIDPEVCNAPVVVQEDDGFDLKSALLGAGAVLGTLLIGR